MPLPAPVVATASWLWLYHCSPVTLPPPPLCPIRLGLSLGRTLVIGLTDHLDNPGRQPHLKILNDLCKDLFPILGHIHSSRVGSRNSSWRPPFCHHPGDNEPNRSGGGAQLEGAVCTGSVRCVGDGEPRVRRPCQPGVDIWPCPLQAMGAQLGFQRVRPLQVTCWWPCGNGPMPGQGGRVRTDLAVAERCKKSSSRAALAVEETGRSPGGSSFLT